MESASEKFSNIYVHFPFCETKCHYCDFFSLPEGRVPASDRTRAYQSLARELDHFQPRLAPSLRTVFFGGGTPSLAPESCLSAIRDKLPVSPDTEFTIEANPSSIDRNKAGLWRSLGVNRVSMGTQSLSNERLRWMGRAHDERGANLALDAIFGAGFENVSIDYIVGVPTQTTHDIRSELGGLLARFPGIKHVSAYLLTLQKSNLRYAELPREDLQIEHLRALSDTLAELGFEHYEVSNFARLAQGEGPPSPWRSQHNSNYWNHGSYLGVGPSAHSFWPWLRKRTKNWASLHLYSERIEQLGHSVELEETLSREQLRMESLLVGLRRKEGIDLKSYEASFGDPLRSRRSTWLAAAQAQGLLHLENDRLWLSRDGFFLIDEILNKLV